MPVSSTQLREPTITGPLGGMASDPSSSNVVLSGTSGATSRVIAYATGAILAGIWWHRERHLAALSRS